MTALAVPPYIERAKIGGAPLGFGWELDQYEFGHGFASDGSRSAIVRKLAPISVRGTLGLLAASAEWLVHRLAGPDDPLPADLVAALWVGSVDPRLVDLTALPYSEGADVYGGISGVGKADPAKGPIREYVSTVRSCYRIAVDFDGAFHSYAEAALRLVDYVMPNSAYRNWRRGCYGHLAALTSSHSMRAVRAMLDARKNAAEAKDDSAIIEQILADGDLDELWGPALPRDAYDPKTTPTAATSAELLAAFLGQARSGRNPFLHSPS